MPPPIARAARLRAELDRLADEVEAVAFGMASEQQSERRAQRDELSGVLRSYLIPRLGDPEAPLLVVVAGPTGSGKSTLVNSLAEHQVGQPGPLRPTTRQPVVWCHQRHADRYRTIGSVACDVVPDDHPLLDALTVVDTPDIDSYVADHRRVTVELLQHADVVVFVTSAQRYADAVPWDVLGAIDRRGSLLVHVLNRLGRRSAGAEPDYTAMLRRHGLESESLHSIQEQRVRGEAGLLPGRAVSRLAGRLRDLAEQRTDVIRQVTEGATAYSIRSALQVADEVDSQEEERRRLEAVVGDAYEGAMSEFIDELDRGLLIRSEVVERWRERVGTSDVARWVRGSASWLRAMADRLSGHPATVVEMIESEARRELADAVSVRLERAARSVTTGWEVDAAGRGLVTDDLRVASEEGRTEAGARIDEWLAALTRLVETEAPGRFRMARITSTGVNAAAVATILGLFAATGGLTGSELGVAAGAAAAQQGILEHVLGRAAAASLSQSARDRLVESVRGVFDTEAARFRRILVSASDPPQRAESIRQAVSVVEAESESFHAG